MVPTAFSTLFLLIVVWFTSVYAQHLLVCYDADQRTNSPLMIRFCDGIRIWTMCEKCCKYLPHFSCWHFTFTSYYHNKALYFASILNLNFLTFGMIWCLKWHTIRIPYRLVVNTINVSFSCMQEDISIGLLKGTTCLGHVHTTGIKDVW